MKLEMTENELIEKKALWETERNSLEKKVSEIEKELFSKEAKERDLFNKYKKIKEEKEEIERNYDKLAQNSKEKEANSEEKFEEYRKKVETRFESVKNEHQLKEKINQISKENERISSENLDLTRKNKKLIQKIDDLQGNSSQEIAVMKLGFEMKIREMTENKEVNSVAKQQVSELLIKNTFLESNINKLEAQLLESKRIYDTLFRTLQSNFHIFHFLLFFFVISICLSQYDEFLLIFL